MGSHDSAKTVINGMWGFNFAMPHWPDHLNALQCIAHTAGLALHEVLRDPTLLANGKARVEAQTLVKDVVALEVEQRGLPQAQSRLLSIRCQCPQSSRASRLSEDTRWIFGIDVLHFPLTNPEDIKLSKAMRAKGATWFLWHTT